MPHPLHQFVYCPQCGNKSFIARNEKASQCNHCGFVYYFNPSAAVACLIRNPQNELLLVRRAKDPAKGTLDLPGGFVDLHESAEQAVIREVKEETGLTLTHFRYLYSIPNIYPYCGFEVHTLDLIYECTVESFDQAIAADDAAEIVIVPVSQIDPELFGLASIKKAIGRYIKL